MAKQPVQSAKMAVTIAVTQIIQHIYLIHAVTVADDDGTLSIAVSAQQILGICACKVIFTL